MTGQKDQLYMYVDMGGTFASSMQLLACRCILSLQLEDSDTT